MKLAAILLALFLAPSSASASVDPITLQMKLVHDGFLDGPTDGAVGPATRKAMAAYATAKNIANNRSAIEARMRSDASIHRGSDISDEVWAAAIEVAKTKLMDPYSAHFTKLYYFKSSTGRVVVCGLVNAKNQFGAYVGDQFFQSYLLDVPLSIGIGTLDTAAVMCDFGISFDDFRKK